MRHAPVLACVLVSLLLVGCGDSIMRGRYIKPGDEAQATTAALEVRHAAPAGVLLTGLDLLDPETGRLEQRVELRLPADEPLLLTGLPVGLFEVVGTFDDGTRAPALGSAPRILELAAATQATLDLDRP